jgi:flavin reductase (DIM6/NTAB) family NADH-FMN oxidoreductase RutF
VFGQFFLVDFIASLPRRFLSARLSDFDGSLVARSTSRRNNSAFFLPELMAMERDLAQTLAGLTTGIYVLTVADGGQYHGMSSSWVTQVSGVPALFSAALDNQHFSRAIVARTGVFGLNIVARRGKALEDYFYSPRARRTDNLEEIEYDLSPHLGVPWLRLAWVSIEARVTISFVAGDHTIFVAEPIGVRINQGDRPLTSLDLDYVYLGGKEVIARDRTGW